MVRAYSTKLHFMSFIDFANLLCNTDCKNILEYQKWSSIFLIEEKIWQEKNKKMFCFIADLKSLYSKVGVEGKPTVFLFNDTQVAEESFLEDVNNILSSGEVPNLYKPEEFEEVSFITFFFLFFHHLVQI